MLVPLAVVNGTVMAMASGTSEPYAPVAVSVVAAALVMVFPATAQVLTASAVPSWAV